MSTIVLGDGPLGRAIGAALEARGETVRGPSAGPPAAATTRATLAGADLVVDASRARAVADNVEAALDAGCRRFVIATTGWDATRALSARPLRSAGAAAVVAPNLAPGAAVFLRLVERGSRARRGDGRLRAGDRRVAPPGEGRPARPGRPGS